MDGVESTGTTIGILLAGVAVVVGGVLLLRLHAFLALLLGALLVGALTPPGAVERFALEKDALKILGTDPGARSVTLPAADPQAIPVGTPFLLVRRSSATGRYEAVARLAVERHVSDGAGKTGAVARIEGDGVLPAPRDLVVPPYALARARKAVDQSVGERVAAGFGGTATSIGILIAMASIVGLCLLQSGAADRIVRTALRLTGEAGAPLAFLLSGFLLGVPVFFDTVFYLMIPLGKALGMRTGRCYLFYVLTIVAGGTMAHSLVPPTPGPLFVAEQLNVSIGAMMVAGTVVGLASSAFGYFFARLANERWPVPLRDSLEMPLEQLQALSKRAEHELPPFWLAVIPIVLPVVLLGGSAMAEAAGWEPSAPLRPWVQAGSDKNIALALAALIALLTLAWQRRPSREELSESVRGAVTSAGEIILITAAGGAFGAVLQQTGVAGLVSELPRSSPAVLLTLAFLITTAIRTAQGSATVAMITAVGVLSGLAADGLGFHPVYLALAIGCGSKPIAWMNDSGFWVITRMSGMTEAESLRSVTPMTALMGVVGLLVTLVLATLFPTPF
ncbi:MAG: GntP family permease [Armatimonadota bacterium]